MTKLFQKVKQPYNRADQIKTTPTVSCNNSVKWTSLYKDQCTLPRFHKYIVQFCCWQPQLSYPYAMPIKSLQLFTKTTNRIYISDVSVNYVSLTLSVDHILFERQLFEQKIFSNFSFMVVILVKDACLFKGSFCVCYEKISVLFFYLRPYKRIYYFHKL